MFCQFSLFFLHYAQYILLLNTKSPIELEIRQEYANKHCARNFKPSIFSSAEFNSQFLCVFFMHVKNAMYQVSNQVTNFQKYLYIFFHMMPKNSYLYFKRLFFFWYFYRVKTLFLTGILTIFFEKNFPKISVKMCSSSVYLQACKCHTVTQHYRYIFDILSELKQALTSCSMENDDEKRLLNS